MAQKKSAFLWIGLAGIAAVAGYEIYKSKQTAATDTGSTGPINTYPTTDTGSNNNYVTQPAASTGIDPAVYSIVQNWGLEDGRAGVQKFLAANIPAEYNGMYDIIFNYWDKGVPVGDAQTTFWNNLRTKYDPQHLTW